MEQIKKNTVPSEKQLAVSSHVFFENREGKGVRVLFAGNSITLHGYKPDIGWYGKNYGMAASSKENDYVHLVMKKILQTDSDAVTCICQVADWERNYKKGSEILYNYKEAHDFKANIIIIRLLENCSQKDFDSEAFSREYNTLIDYLNPCKNAKIILTTSFWKHIADNTIFYVGKERGYKTIFLGELGEDDSMKAIGKFEHSGVANHPGDKGMKRIAEMIISAL